MNTSLSYLLIISFVVSLVALGFLIWAIVNQQIKAGKKEASVIFLEGEEGAPDDVTSFDSPALHQFDVEREGIDRPGQSLVLSLISIATFFLILGSLYGAMASLKLHMPDWLVSQDFFTFGRARTVHLNLVAYGWLSVGGLAVVMWIVPRIFHTPLRRPRMALWGGVIWAIGVLAGATAISKGWTDGLEWLEIPWQIDILLVIGGFFLAWPVIDTAINRKSQHIYVSGWYFLAALVWFPILFLVSNIPGLHLGTQQATVNWWFAHNVLGLWLTPLGVGAAYYLIPKIIGKPIYSYSVSLLGFWGLALFYAQVGIHHLIGGPIPTWVVTLSIIHSVMMFIPVIAVAINQHTTVIQNFWAFKKSMALRFVATGALMYTAASFQGSLEALRSVNSVTHFTHFTVAHAHLGVYGFVSVVLFGAFYYLIPHLLKRPWPSPKLITLHYWFVVLGFGIYFFSLTIGGWLQGLALLDIGSVFAQITRNTIPYLEARSVGGIVMTLGHFIFAYQFMAILRSSKGGK